MNAHVSFSKLLNCAIALSFFLGCGAHLDSAEPGPAPDSAPDSQPASSAARDHTLTVKKSGSGGGRVILAVGDQINCGTLCTTQVPHGQQLSLLAQSDPWSRFAGWSGACHGTGPCVLTLDQSLEVTAQFQPLPSWRATTLSMGALLGLWANSPSEVWVTTPTSLQRWSGSTWSEGARLTAQGETLGAGLFGRSDGALFAEVRRDGSSGICESSGSGTWCFNYTRHNVAAYVSQAASSGALSGPKSVTEVAYISSMEPNYSTERVAAWASASTLYAAVCTELSQLANGKSSKLTLPGCAKAIWGTSDADYWLVGKGGAIVRGGTLTKVASPTTLDLYGVWGSSPASYFAVGQDGVILRWNGSQWTTHFKASRTLRAIWGTAENDIWAVGDRGLLLHYDGETWAQQPSDTAKDLYAIFGTSANNLWALGAGGTFLRTVP